MVTRWSVCHGCHGRVRRGREPAGFGVQVLGVGVQVLGVFRDTPCVKSLQLWHALCKVTPAAPTPACPQRMMVQGESCLCNFHPSGWLWASALPCRLISLVGVKWSCLRINEQALTSILADAVPAFQVRMPWLPRRCAPRPRAGFEVPAESQV